MSNIVIRGLKTAFLITRGYVFAAFAGFPSHYYGVTVEGDALGNVTFRAFTTGKNVELVVVDGVNGRGNAVLVKAILALKYHIATHDAPV